MLCVFLQLVLDIAIDLCLFVLGGKRLLGVSLARRSYRNPGVPMA